MHLSCPEVLLVARPSLAFFQVGHVNWLSGKSCGFSFFLPGLMAKEISSFQILLLVLLSHTKTGCSVSTCGSCLATHSLPLLWKLRLLQVAATEVNVYPGVSAEPFKYFISVRLLALTNMHKITWYFQSDAHLMQQSTNKLVFSFWEEVWQEEMGEMSCLPHWSLFHFYYWLWVEKTCLSSLRASRSLHIWPLLGELKITLLALQLRMLVCMSIKHILYMVLV